MTARDLCDLILGIDPLIELAIIRKNFTVKWANEVHLERYRIGLKELKDRCCYELWNGFSQPCKWCPAKQTFKDKKIHEELVCSPMGNDVVFSNIVTLPIMEQNEEVTEVVEIIFNSTACEKIDLRQRAERYRSIADFGQLLEELNSESDVPILLLVGAVWEKCLNFRKAHILLVEETGQTAWPKVVQIHELKQTDVFNRLISEFKHKMTGEYIDPLRVRLKEQCLKSELFPMSERPFLNDKISELFGAGNVTLRNIMRPGERFIRLSSSKVATTIAGSEGRYILVGQTVDTGCDLVTDRDLMDIGIFGSVVERAIRNRKLTKDVSVALKNCKEFLDRVEKDAGALVFASSIVTSFAHELITSCNNLRSHAYHIWAMLDADKQEECEFSYKDFKRETIFIKECMERAVDIGRIELVTKEHFRQCDMHELIWQAKENFSSQLKKRHISFNFRPTSENAIVTCDKLLIKQVLSNLILNACTSLGRTSHRQKLEISVRTERASEFFHIIIRDNGLGIDPTIRENIWQPFFSTKEEGRGTGLGLMICQRIVEGIHKGQIKVASRHGFGAKFVIVLPLDG